MKKHLIALYIPAAASFAALAWICLHSVEEIHYLKSFFPRQFTVQEAGFAAIVEFVKVIILSIPLVGIIILCLAVAFRLSRANNHANRSIMRRSIKND